MRESWSVDALESKCIAIGLAPAPFVRCWIDNEKQISRSLVSKVSSTSQLMDMDWSFGVTTATNDCDQVGSM